MKFLQYIAIIVIVLECTTAQQEFDALKYLVKYGYGHGIKTNGTLITSEISSSNKTIETNPEYIDMIKLFQSNFNLEVTGTLDNNTIKLMKTPRCGCPDIVIKSNKSGPSSFVLGGTKWQKNDLTYRCCSESRNKK